MSGQELVPDEPSSPVIPTVRKTTLAMLKNRVEVLEKEMAGLMGHLGRDSNMEPMQLEEGTLNIQEFNSMDLLQDAQKRKKMREELREDMKMLKADIMVEMKEELKVELKQEILEDLKVKMEEALSKEIGTEKEILRKMKMCFVSDTMPAKSTQVTDGDLPENENYSEDSQESVSLLKKYHCP